MTDQENVIPIGRATLARARVLSSPKADAGFQELAREAVGAHTFVAEHGRVRGKDVWRIRIEGTNEVIDYFEPAIHRNTFAALVGTEPAALDNWLSGRAFVQTPTI